MRNIILGYLQIIPSANAEMMAQELGLTERDVQAALHKMDDDGDVILRCGWYRISAAAKMRLGEGLDQS